MKTLVNCLKLLGIFLVGLVSVAGGMTLLFSAIAALSYVVSTYPGWCFSIILGIPLTIIVVLWFFVTGLKVIDEYRNWRGLPPLQL